MKMLFLLLLGATAHAQHVAELYTVTGKVFGENHLPISGITIQSALTKHAVISDSSGRFMLQKIPKNDQLVVSGINYKARLIPVNGKANLSIVLPLSVSNLDSVRVIVNNGYQFIPKDRATGSFVQVDNALINRKVSPDIISRLEGVVSGLAFNIDVDPRFKSRQLSVRGRSTIFSNQDPLIVVDNFPYEGSIDNINPNDVESISILKDAAAASIWGTRASNGVIVLTTKRGRLNEKGHLEANTNVTISGKPDVYYVPRASSADYIEVEKLLFDNQQYDWMLQDQYGFPALSPVVETLAAQKNGRITADEANAEINRLSKIDNRADLFRFSYKPAIAQQYAVSLSGGSSLSTYYLSAGFDHGQGSLGDLSNRATINMRNSYNVGKKLVFNVSATYVKADTKAATRSNAIPHYPYERIYDDQGNGQPITGFFRDSFANDALRRGLLDWSVNPVKDAALTNSITTTGDARFSLGGRYKLSNSFNIDLEYQFQQQNIDQRNLIDSGSSIVANLVNSYTQVDPATGEVLARPLPEGAILDRQHAVSAAHNGRAQLNFHHLWGDHELTALGGFDLRQVHTEGEQSRLYGYDDNTFVNQTVDYLTYFTKYPYGSDRIQQPPGTGSDRTDRFRSYYANASYTFKGKYTLSGSARKDESNYFGVRANQRRVPLWSSGVKWDVNKELFYHSAWLPLLSLRASYGYNGNINKSLTAFTTAIAHSNIYNLYAAYITNPPNKDLRWERVGVTNIAVDFSLKKQIFSGTVEYFVKDGKDLIGQGLIDPTIGPQSISGNLAGMRGRGWDLTLNSTPVDRKLKWQINFVGSYSIEKVTKYNIPFSSYEAINSSASINPIVGKPLYSVYSLKWGGLDPVTGDPQGFVDGKVSKDYSSLLFPPASDLVYNGTLQPKFYGGVRNTFSFMDFSVSANILFKGGNYFRRNSINYTQTFYSGGDLHPDYDLRWKKPGDEKSTNVPSIIVPSDGNRDNFYALSQILVEKADFVRLQDIQLAYDPHWFSNSKASFSRIQLYAYINNIGLLWRANKSGIDPDFQQQIPAVRSYSIGLRFSN